MSNDIKPNDGNGGTPVVALTEDDIRIWGELWSTVHSDHYACCYEEATAEFLVSRWRLLDTVSKFLTSLTASGSAVAAWAVWASTGSGQVTWAVLSGAAALISLIHMSLGISDRIKEDTLIFSTFQQLRLDLETFKKKMRLRQHDSLTAYLNDYIDVSSKFGKAYALKRPDFFLTQTQEVRIQNDVNKRLGLESNVQSTTTTAHVFRRRKTCTNRCATAFYAYPSVSTAASTTAATTAS